MTPSRTATSTPTATAAPVAGDIVNANFELGTTGWVETSSNAVGSVSISAWAGFPSWFGSIFAWIGGTINEVATISQTITVPSGATTLRVHQGMASYEPACATSADKARFTVNGTTVREWTLCNHARWTTVAEYDTLEFDLSAYAGQSVTLGFSVDNDANNSSSWYIDTVHFVPGVTNMSLRNADFSVSDDGSWAENSRELGDRIGQMIIGGTAKLGTFGDESKKLTSRRVSQYVSLPSTTRSLVFSIAPHTNEYCGFYYDVLNIEVDEVIVGRVDISRCQPSGQLSIDMTPYATKRVKIGFNFVTDSSISGEVTVDNVALSTVAAGANRAPMVLLATPKTVIVNQLFQK